MTLYWVSIYKKGTQIDSYVDGGNQEFGKRAGTENTASIIAMAVALKNNYKNIEANNKHLKELEEIFTDRLNTGHIDYITPLYKFYK